MMNDVSISELLYFSRLDGLFDMFDTVNSFRTKTINAENQNKYVCRISESGDDMEPVAKFWNSPDLCRMAGEETSLEPTKNAKSL